MIDTRRQHLTRYKFQLSGEKCTAKGIHGSFKCKRIPPFFNKPNQTKPNKPKYALLGGGVHKDLTSTLKSRAAVSFKTPNLCKVCEKSWHKFGY